MTREFSIDTIITLFKQNTDNSRIEGMKKVGITPERAFGVSIPFLRELAKKIGKNHELALELWNINTRETRILACMVDDVSLLTEEQMELWVKDFDYWEICDQCIMNLFEKSKYAYQKAIDWTTRTEEYVKRSGFVLIARLAFSDKKASNDIFQSFFPIISKEANDQRNSVKKAISWALRQIGKRNNDLNAKTLDLANKLLISEEKNTQWIAKDVIKDISGRF
ncbi:MAG: DNA alkylation repair protein [Candidatus Thorarchaeota archaeon]